LVVGYDESRNAFKVINSWGVNWGNEGYLWIDYEVFKKIVIEAFVVEDTKGGCAEEFNVEQLELDLTQEQQIINNFMANAGENKIVEELSLVTLEGNYTKDQNYTYQWQQISGTSVEISNDNTRVASFVAPNVNKFEVLEFNLTVTDKKEVAYKDNVKVTVIDQSFTDSTPLIIVDAGNVLLLRLINRLKLQEER